MYKYHGGFFLRIKVTKWPKQASLRVIEKGKIKDSVLAEVFLTIPGYGGTPSHDDRPVPYQWTSSLVVKPLWLESEPSSAQQPGNASQSMHYSGALFVQCGWSSMNNEVLGMNMTGRLNPQQPSEQDADISSRMEEGWLSMPPPPKLSVDGVLRRSLCQVSTQQTLEIYHQFLAVPGLTETLSI